MYISQMEEQQLKKTITVGSGSLTVTAKYKGTLGNTVKIVSVANPVDGFDVSVVINWLGG